MSVGKMCIEKNERTTECALENGHTSEKFPPERLLFGRVQSAKGADGGAKFEIFPIRASDIPLQRLQMVAGHLNVPTLW